MGYNLFAYQFATNDTQTKTIGRESLGEIETEFSYQIKLGNAPTWAWPEPEDLHKKDAEPFLCVPECVCVLHFTWL